MPELHLCIATGQNAANFIPLKQLGAQDIRILETPDMATLHSGANLKTALAPYAAQVRRIDFDDATPERIKANSTWSWMSSIWIAPPSGLRRIKADTAASVSKCT